MAIDIKGAFKTVNEAMRGILQVGIITAIAVIILGVLINAVTGGSITLSTAFNTLLNTLDATMAGWFTNAIPVVLTIVGLIVVVVLAKLFKNYFEGKKGKGGDAM